MASQCRRTIGTSSSSSSFEQPGAEPVVDVVIVIGDVVGDAATCASSDGQLAELEIELGIGLGQRPGRLRRSVRYAWQALRALPS